MQTDTHNHKHPQADTNTHKQTCTQTHNHAKKRKKEKTNKQTPQTTRYHPTHLEGPRDGLGPFEKRCQKLPLRGGTFFLLGSIDEPAAFLWLPFGFPFQKTRKGGSIAKPHVFFGRLPASFASETERAGAIPWETRRRIFLGADARAVSRRGAPQVLLLDHNQIGGTLAAVRKAQADKPSAWNLWWKGKRGKAKEKNGEPFSFFRPAHGLEPFCCERASM